MKTERTEPAQTPQTCQRTDLWPPAKYSTDTDLNTDTGLNGLFRRLPLPSISLNFYLAKLYLLKSVYPPFRLLSSLSVSPCLLGRCCPLPGLQKSQLSSAAALTSSRPTCLPVAMMEKRAGYFFQYPGCLTKRGTCVLRTFARKFVCTDYIPKTFHCTLWFPVPHCEGYRRCRSSM